MKLKDIREEGFYKEVDSEDLWECIENPDNNEEFRKNFPLLLDSWIYQYTDNDDRKVYEVDGLLYRIGYDYPELEVEKVIDTEYEISGTHGHTLTEKKPTYKEKYEALKEYLETQRPTGICETCTDKANKEADELQTEVKQLKKEIEGLKKYKFLFEKCREYYLEKEKFVRKLLNENEDLKDSLKRTVCQAECYKHKEAEKYKEKLIEIKNCVKIFDPISDRDEIKEVLRIIGELE